MIKENYRPFSTYVVRIPTLPVMQTNETCLELFSTDNRIRKAIFVASPDLYQSMLNLSGGKITCEKKKQRILTSYLKYLSRMSSRCTPFGLFAACGSGKIDMETKICPETEACFETHTRLDMNYLCELSIHLSKDPLLRKHLRFFPNSSSYETGRHIRYVEYRYVNGKRVHFAVSVENDEQLSKLIAKAKEGLTMDELIRQFSADDYRVEEIQDYIGELIDSQLLVSELEPSVCGEEYLRSILGILARINPAGEIYRHLKKVNSLLSKFDENPEHNNLDLLQQIESALDFFPLQRKKKFLFQMDSKLAIANGKLNNDICTEILEASNVLQKLTRTAYKRHWNDFKKRFYERFEERSVPLGKVFDTESGISYLQNHDGDISPLLDKLNFPATHQNNSKSEWEAVDYFLLRKMTHFLTSDDKEIVLDEEELQQLPVPDTEFPNTCYAIAEIGTDQKTNETVSTLSAIGGSTAANLLGRFCHSNPEIRKLVEEIAGKENELEEGKIVAEISHLPESRTGNVLLRPHIYNYEIPYLSNSTHPRQLGINDLLVSAPYGRKIVLREKNSGKEVVPRLTTAHNYSYNSLPIYHFLCDLQNQNKTGGLSFSWGPLAREFRHFPRVRYKNIILAPEQWQADKKELSRSYECIDDEKGLLKAIRAFQSERKVKDKVVLAEGDNTLLIDFTQIQMVKVFLQAVKNKPSFILKEFFFHEHRSVVKGKSGEYTNQFILPFFKNHSQNK